MDCRRKSYFFILSTMYHYQMCAIWNSTGIEVTLVQYSVPFQIQRAYRRKALRCHSDKETNNARAAEFFHELPGALEILTGSSARAITIFSICSISYYIACLSYWWQILFAKDWIALDKISSTERGGRLSAKRFWKKIGKRFGGKRKRGRERANSTNDDTSIVEISFTLLSFKYILSVWNVTALITVSLMQALMEKLRKVGNEQLQQLVVV